MLKAALTSLAVAGLLVVPATSQTVTLPSRGAPITKGVTTGDLSVQRKCTYGNANALSHLGPIDVHHSYCKSPPQH